VQTYGRFRVRRDNDGALEVWARGWRLEVRALAVAPAALAAVFLVSPAAIPFRVVGCLALLTCAWVTARLGRLGFRMTPEALEVVGVLRTTKVAWDDVAGFVGERNPHEGRAILMTSHGGRVPAPGTFAAEEMDPYGDEGDLSIVDELNRLVWRIRRGESALA
jgi:hypothetical protein